MENTKDTNFLSQLHQKVDEHMALSDFTGALESVNGAIGEKPDHPALHALQGQIYENMGRLKDALESFQKAAGYDPHCADYLYWSAEIQLMLYNVTEAVEICRKGRKLYPGDYRFVMVEADAWLWSIPVLDLAGPSADGAIDKAWALLNHAISLKPEDGEIRVVEATAHLLKGNYSRCCTAFESALRFGLELYGDYVDVGLCLAILYIRSGQMDKARKHIDRALEKFKNWKEPHYLKLMLFQEHLLMLREIYFDDGDIQPEMESFFDEHRILTEKGTKVHFLSRGIREGVLSFVRHRNGNNPEKAAAVLEDLMGYFNGKLPLCIIFHTIKRPSLETLFNIYLGDMHKKQGNRDKAEASYRRALEISPGDPGARRRMENLTC